MITANICGKCPLIVMMRDATLTMNCFHIEEEIVASELLFNKIHVMTNTKMPQTNRNADLKVKGSL